MGGCRVAASATDCGGSWSLQGWIYKYRQRGKMCLGSGTLLNCDKTGTLAEDNLPIFNVVCAFPIIS